MSSQLDCLVLTFNCGREAVKPAILGQYIARAIEDGPKHEVFVFSLQEISPISYGFLGGRFLDFYYKGFQEALKVATGSENYVNVFTGNIGITATMVFVHQDYKDHTKVVESGSVGLGWLDMGNKGAVGTKLRWRASPEQHLDLTFVAAHLAPHEPALERRNQDWMHIVQRLILQPKKGQASYPKSANAQDPHEQSLTDLGTGERQPLLSNKTASEITGNDREAKLPTIYSRSSYTFFAGDLNYRTSNDHPKTEDLAKFPKSSDSTTLISALWKQDQLTSQRKQNKTLHGFHEAKITFPPTYKYTSESQKEAATAEDDGSFTKKSQPPGDVVIPLGYAQHRWPSWCDRVLYLPALIDAGREEAKVKSNFYKSLPLMSTSDHQPVMASFSISFNNIPSLVNGTYVANNDYRIQPPFDIDPLWKERFTTARRKEFAVGLLAYLGMTWEGNTILFTIVIGATGIYLASRSGLF